MKRATSRPCPVPDNVQQWLSMSSNPFETLIQLGKKKKMSKDKAKNYNYNL